MQKCAIKLKTYIKCSKISNIRNMCNNEKYMWQIKQKMDTAHFQGCFIIKYYFCH